MTRRTLLLLAVVLALGFAPAPFPKRSRHRPPSSKEDLKRLQGTWEIIGYRMAGQDMLVVEPTSGQVEGARRRDCRQSRRAPARTDRGRVSRGRLRNIPRTGERSPPKGVHEFPLFGHTVRLAVSPRIKEHDNAQDHLRSSLSRRRQRRNERLVTTRTRS